jgi:hemerythrin-like domain-containing protein
MAIPAQAPADTAMMGIVHSALRRDLTRTSDVVSGDSAPGAVQRQAIARHLVWMMSFLHRHHAGEDDGLWPLVRRHDPTSGALLDEMDADHARIAPQVESVASAGKRYGSDSSPQARDSLLAAIASLRDVLDPHLRKEEEEAMPVVSRALTHAQWEAFNQEHYIKPKSKKELGREGHWLIDSIDPAGYTVVVGNVSPIPRFVLLHVFAGPYARACAARWGLGVSIKPLHAGIL